MLSGMESSQPLDFDCSFLQPPDGSSSGLFQEIRQPTYTSTPPHINSGQYTTDTLGSHSFGGWGTSPMALEPAHLKPDVHPVTGPLVNPSCWQPFAVPSPDGGQTFDVPVSFFPARIPEQQLPETSFDTALPAQSLETIEGVTRRAVQTALAPLLPKQAPPQPGTQLCRSVPPSHPSRKRPAPDWKVTGVPPSLCGGFQVHISGPEPKAKKPRRAAKACFRCSVQKKQVGVGQCLSTFGAFTDSRRQCTGTFPCSNCQQVLQSAGQNRSRQTLTWTACFEPDLKELDIFDAEKVHDLRLRVLSRKLGSLIYDWCVTAEIERTSLMESLLPSRRIVVTVYTVGSEPVSEFAEYKRQQNYGEQETSHSEHWSETRCGGSDVHVPPQDREPDYDFMFWVLVNVFTGLDFVRMEGAITRLRRGRSNGSEQFELSRYLKILLLTSSVLSDRLAGESSGVFKDAWDCRMVRLVSVLRYYLRGFTEVSLVEQNCSLAVPRCRIEFLEDSATSVRH